MEESLIDTDHCGCRLANSRKADFCDGLEVRQLKRCDETQEIARKLETYHPTLFFGANGDKAAWIEGLIGEIPFSHTTWTMFHRESSTAARRNANGSRRAKDLRFVYENSTPMAFA